MNYPENVKDIKNLNEFIREARKLETDTYWANILYDCSSANYSDWTRKESRLKWKRDMIQKYLNYKNNKLEESNKKLILYHNTSNENAVKINKEGIIPGLRLDAYGKDSEAEGSGVWCSTIRGYGYGGATITFEIDKDDEAIIKQNDTEYIIYRKIEPKEIIDIDLVISNLKNNNSPYDTLESDIPVLINKYGKEKILEIFIKYDYKFIKPYNLEQFKYLLKTGEKYCKGRIKIVESANRLLNKIPEQQKYKVKDFYKDALGQYTIDLNDGYETSYGTNYIQCKTIKDCLNELEEFVSDKLNESKTIQGLESYSEEEIKNSVKRYIKNVFADSLMDYDIFDIVDIQIHGSRGRGTAKDDSDLDVVVEYTGDFREDDLFNLLNDDPLYIEDIQVDINPIRAEETGTMSDYMKRSDEYDKEILSKKQEKASIDWNNYLTELDVHRILRSKDSDKTIKDLINSRKFDELYKNEFKQSGWTKSKLEDDIKKFKQFNHFITESKHKLEEKSRNELLAKTKSQTVTRYDKAAGYKGFYIYDIDTTNIFNKNSNLLITCKVGDYHSQVEIENTLWWVEYEVDERGHNTQVTTKYVTQALMDAIDGMNIKVNCECGDWIYRMKYQATQYGYNYGRPENRPAKITNPNDIGALCKHLTAMLSNKKWIQQVTSTLMDYIVKNIDKVNQFLNRKPGQELTVPNEAQRRLGKQAAYSKVLSRQEILQNVANDFIKEVGDKILTQNINLDDDLRRFINTSNDYSWQKIQPNEFRVIKGYIDDYISKNKPSETDEK